MLRESSHCCNSRAGFLFVTEVVDMGASTETEDYHGSVEVGALFSRMSIYSTGRRKGADRLSSHRSAAGCFLAAN
jgi:hypothetical protein